MGYNISVTGANSFCYFKRRAAGKGFNETQLQDIKQPNELRSHRAARSYLGQAVLQRATGALLQAGSYIGVEG